jgi:hypothetical protein
MDKIHAMQLFVRVAELEVFPARRNINPAERQRLAANSGPGKPAWHPAIAPHHARVSLTQDGMVYYERAKDLLANLDELDGMFQHDPSSISGRLRVDMPVGVARNLVIPKLPAFLQQYPGIELELSSSDRLVDVIREGFDCVVRVGTLKDSGLIARPLGKLSVINCASPDYLARFGYPETLDDLGSHAVIHYAAMLGTRPQGFEFYNGSDAVDKNGRGIDRQQHGNLPGCLPRRAGHYSGSAGWGARFTAREETD